jgi:hypothetical protein
LYFGFGMSCKYVVKRYIQLDGGLSHTSL